MSGRAKLSSSKWLVWVFLTAGLLLMVGANVHLLYVAMVSQPDCVDHLKEPGKGSKFRAAKSAC